MPDLLPFFRTLWRHVAFNYREGGLSRVGYKVVYRLNQWWRSEASWWIYEIEPPDLPLTAPPSIAVSHQILSFDDLLRLGYFKASLFPEGLQSRFRQGMLCHGLLCDGVLVNVGWTRIGAMELETDLTIPVPGGASIFDCHTESAFRGRGLYPYSLITMIRFLAAQDLNRIWIAVDPGNIPSIKGIERAGFPVRFCLTRKTRFGSVHLETGPRQSLLQPGVLTRN